jgi:tryptophan synthase beta chain
MAEYTNVDDAEALRAAETLCRIEGILPALESAHAVAYAMKLAGEMDRGSSLVVCLSGRGDKDVSTLIEMRGAGDEPHRHLPRPGEGV